MIIGTILVIWIICGFIASCVKYHMDQLSRLMSLSYLKADSAYWVKNISVSFLIGPIYILWILIKLFLWKKL